CTLKEVSMPDPNVLNFAEEIPAMTYAEGLAFIERTRRQLDRFDVAFPGANGQRMNSETEAKIRAICDELEADIRKSLGDI
ncbi:MAG: hypothetical protein WBY61_02050, partial [Terriglobales bacterium]